MLNLLIVGLFNVNEKQRAIIERFGKYKDTRMPGLRMIWFPGIMDVVNMLLIKQETIALFSSPIKIDFLDGSATPKNVKAFIEVESPDSLYQTVKKEAGIKVVENRPGSYRAVYHIADRKKSIIDLLYNASRSYLNRLTLDEGIEKARAGYNLFNGLKKSDSSVAKELQATLHDWGTILHRITVGDFDLEPDLVKARGDVHKMQKQKEASVYVSVIRAEETEGAAMEMFFIRTGISRKDAEKLVQDDPEVFEKKYGLVWKECVDIVHRRMGIDGKAQFEFRAPDGSSPESLIALAARMFGSIGPGSGEKNNKEGKEEVVVEEKKEEQQFKRGPSIRPQFNKK